MENNVKQTALTKVVSGAKKVNHVALALFVTLMCSSNAFALHGGFNTVTTDTSSLQKWLYGVVGIVALGYLTFIALKIKAQKATWHDFGTGLFHVAIAGGAVTAGTYFYNMFA